MMPLRKMRSRSLAVAELVLSLRASTCDRAMERESMKRAREAIPYERRGNLKEIM